MMRTFNRQLLIIALLVPGTFAMSQEQTAFSLVEAEAFGVQNNEKVLNVLLDVEAAQKKIWETTAIGLPQVSATGSFQHYLDIPVAVVPASTFNPGAGPDEVLTFQMGQKYNSSLAFNVSQLIFDGSYIIGLQFAKFYSKMAETAVTNTQNEVKAMVREAYYNVLVADKNLQLIDSVMVNTQKLWNEIQVFQKHGMIKSDEVNQMELAYNRIAATRQNALRQTEIARNLLKLQMGYDFEKSISLTETFDDVVKAIEQANPLVQEFNVASNSTYMMVDQQRQMDEYALRNQKAAYMPSVGAFFTHSQNAFRNEFNFTQNLPWYPTTIWGVSMQIPIASSGQKVVRVQQAEIKLEQDNNTVELVERSLEFQELQLKAGFENAYQLMKIEQMNVELATRIYNDEIKRKDIGVGSGFRVTQLQAQLLTAQGSYIGAVMQMFAYKIQLDKLFNQ
jgi:outer membrane protein